MYENGQKAFSFREASTLAPPASPGALPLDPAGAAPQDPRYRLALRARHGPVPDKSWIRRCPVGLDK